jgi:PAS domain-containing protein
MTTTARAPRAKTRRTVEAITDLKTGALQDAILNSANFLSIATDAKGVIQIFNVGAERMLGYEAAEVMNKITPADISDPQEVIARAKALSVELGTTITGFEALVFKASRGIGTFTADLYPQRRQPLPGSGVGHGAAGRAGRHHRLSAHRHRQHRAEAGGRRCSKRAPCRARSSTAPTFRVSPPTRRA